jgi:hypothetical protein
VLLKGTFFLKRERKTTQTFVLPRPVREGEARRHLAEEVLNLHQVPSVPPKEFGSRMDSVGEARLGEMVQSD